MLHLTSRALLQDKLVDEIVAEPEGGAHRDPAGAAAGLKARIQANLSDLSSLNTENLLAQRYAKFRAMGVYHEAEPAAEPEPEPPS